MTSVTIEFYERREGVLRQRRWRWRAIAGNREIIAGSSESYVEERGARYGFNVLRSALSQKDYAATRLPLP